MGFTKGLSSETVRIFQRIYQQSKKYGVTRRAHRIFLSFQGYSSKNFLKILSMSRTTVHNWLDKWEGQKLVGLYKQKGRVRKQIFSKFQKAQVKEWVKESPKEISKVLSRIEKKWSLRVSRDNIKRILKELRMSRHRVKSKK